MLDAYEEARFLCYQNLSSLVSLSFLVLLKTFPTSLHLLPPLSDNTWPAPSPAEAAWGSCRTRCCRQVEGGPEKRPECPAAYLLPQKEFFEAILPMVDDKRV